MGILSFSRRIVMWGTNCSMVLRRAIHFSGVSGSRKRDCFSLPSALKILSMMWGDMLVSMYFRVRYFRAAMGDSLWVDWWVIDKKKRLLWRRKESIYVYLLFYLCDVGEVWGLGMGSWCGVLGWGIGMGSWDGVLGGLDGDGHCFDDAFGMCLFGYGGKEGLWMVGVVYGADGCNFVAEDSAGRGRSGFEVGGGYDGYRW